MQDLLFAGELNVDLVLTGVRQAPAFGTEILADDLGVLFPAASGPQNLPALYEKARKRGMTTSLDAGRNELGRWNGGLPEILRFTDFFFPNDKEACPTLAEGERTLRTGSAV